MKTTNYRLLILITFFFIGVSCEDKLEPVDPNNTGDAVALANDKNVKTTLLGAYNGLSAGAFFGGNTFRNSEILAANGEIVFSGTFNDVADIYRKEMITLNADVAALWTNAYNTINVTNNVLSALDVVNEEDRDQVEGEALFLRGVSYFELIKFFAKPYSAGSVSTNLGVPLMLTEDRNSVALVPRATVQEVYTQIVADLTSAETKLAEGPSPGKATKEAAAAFLSRVYLQMADYANARDAANRVITSGNYSLLPTYANCFNTGTTAEDIFDIPVSTVDGVNNMVTFFAPTASGGRGDIEIQTAHLDLYEVDDDRLDFFFADPGTGETRSGKWTNQFGNVKVIRLAEMYLTRAECNQRLGTSVGATPAEDIDDVIRDRVGLPPIGTITLADILLERKLELAHEGERLHDAKRLQESIVEGALVFPYDSDKLIFPIPQRDINVNPNLIQNSGYN
ncbi:MAG: RagB/SusD family nutrient uptake outer membrane protein [Cyclobacteriaceae bacterium]|nr:MAG: RagB/SusD family nutrient uptake outer membrane protein [Cyclobacteriaceae bacterium]